MLQEARLELFGRRKEQVAGLELLEDQRGDGGQRLALLMEKLQFDVVALVPVDPVGDQTAELGTGQRQHFFDITDLADEEAAVLAREQRHGEAVVLVARAHQRTRVGRRGQFQPIGERDRQRNLTPQAQRFAHEEGHAPAHGRQAFLQGHFDAFQLAGHVLAQPTVFDRFQFCTDQILEGHMPGVLQPPLRCQLQIQADDRIAGRLNRAQLPEGGRRQQPIGRLGAFFFEPGQNAIPQLRRKRFGQVHRRFFHRVLSGLGDRVHQKLQVRASCTRRRARCRISAVSRTDRCTTMATS